MYFFSLGIYLSMGFLVLGHIFAFVSTWKKVFQSDRVTISSCQQHGTKVSVPLHPRRLQKKLNSSGMCVVGPYCGFNLHFSVTSGESFRVFIGQFNIFSVEVLFSNLNCILLGYLHFSYRFGVFWLYWTYVLKISYSVVISDWKFQVLKISPVYHPPLSGYCFSYPIQEKFASSKVTFIFFCIII